MKEEGTVNLLHAHLYSTKEEETLELLCADIDSMREEELEQLLGTVDGMDLEGNKRVRRPTVLDLKSAVEAAEQQSSKRLRTDLLEVPPDPHKAPMPQHYYEEPDPAK